jgi:putative DNA methyltransferase yeeA
LQAEFDKTIFTGNDKISARNINPYLADADNIFVDNFFDSISNLPKMLLGNIPNDGDLLVEYSDLEIFQPYCKFVKRFYGA